MQRAKECPASLALPRAPDRGGSSASSHGTRFHSFMERLAGAAKDLILTGATPIDAIDQAIDEALSVVPPADRLAFAQVDHEWLVPLLDAEEIVAEEGYAYHVRTLSARITGVGQGHGVAVVDPANEIPGVIDLRVLLPGGVLYLLDYKTGHGYVPAARVNMQLRTAALAAARALQALGVEITEVRVGIAYIRRGREDEAWFDHAEFTLDDLESIELEIHEILDRQREQRRRLHLIESGAPDAPRLDYVTGEHCTYCASFPWCEPKMRLLQAVCNEPAAVEAKLMEPMTEQQMAEAYRRWKASKDVTKRAGAIIYAGATAHPLPLGDGRFLGLRMVPKKVLDGDVVFEVLEARAANLAEGDPVRDGLALMAVKFTASKGGLEDAAKALANALGLKRGGAKMTRELTAEIETKGGIVDKSRERVTEYKEKTVSAESESGDDDGEAEAD
jgi:hypothetical protein